MTRKKKPTTKRKVSSTRVRARGNSSRLANASLSGVSRFGLPLLISSILIVALAVLGATFYQSATGSTFFRVRSIEVRGNEHTPAEDIRRLVNADVEQTGAWNADLAEIRAKIEKFPYVRSAAVSRLLPGTIRVDIVERIPAALVRMTSGNYIVDGDGILLEKAGPNDQRFPFAMHGWDESKTEKAMPENIARLKVYKKMLEEWRQFDLASRVRHVDLSSLREPKATIEDSGRPIAVLLARENLGRSLKTAIEAVSGKGAKVQSVNVEGVSPVLSYSDF